MERNHLAPFAHLLRQQRKKYLDAFRRAEADFDSIDEERESEAEEPAQYERKQRPYQQIEDPQLC